MFPENCPDIPESAEEETTPVDRPETALKVLRDWNPPLLGELPPTFLKVAGMPIAKSNKVRKCASILTIPFLFLTC